MLPFSLAWTAFALFFLVVGVGTYLNERRTYQVLTQEGVSGLARVTLLYQDTDSDGNTTFYVGYQYTAPVAGEMTVLTAQQSIPPELYQRLEDGMQVEILYAASQPTLSELKDNFNPPGLTMLVCFGGMGLLFTGIGIVLVVSALSSMGRLLFKKEKDAGPG
jgi:hypothetical protein